MQVAVLMPLRCNRQVEMPSGLAKIRTFGLPGGDRTPDPQLRRLLLYPTELRAEIER